MPADSGIGQLLNVTSLAADTGITGVTAECWLSVLEASHLILPVRPWFTNTSMRLVKTPKIYFTDPGLAAWSLGVRKPGHLTANPQHGALFGNRVMTVLLKSRTKHGTKPTLPFLRDKKGHEVDAFIETAPKPSTPPRSNPAKPSPPPFSKASTTGAKNSPGNPSPPGSSMEAPPARKGKKPPSSLGTT